jgi:hypothetical protein
MAQTIYCPGSNSRQATELQFNQVAEEVKTEEAHPPVELVNTPMMDYLTGERGVSFAV